MSIKARGLVNYVSEVYGGSASDRQICERSGLVNIVDSADSIMADKGFNVHDLFLDSNIQVNIPEMFKPKTRMSERFLIKDRKIAITITIYYYTHFINPAKETSGYPLQKSVIKTCSLIKVLECFSNPKEYANNH